MKDPIGIYENLKEQYFKYIVMSIKKNFKQLITSIEVTPETYKDILNNQELFNYILHNLPELITNEVEEPGQYELQIFKLIVREKKSQPIGLLFPGIVNL